MLLPEQMSQYVAETADIHQPGTSTSSLTRAQVQPFVTQHACNAHCAGRRQHGVLCATTISLNQTPAPT